MSEHFKPTGPTIKVKIPAYTVEVCVAGWAAAYGLVPEFDQTMIQAVRNDVQYYFGSTAEEHMVDSTGAAQCGVVQAV